MNRSELQVEISRILHSGIARHPRTLYAAAILATLQVSMTEGTEIELFRVVTEFTRHRVPIGAGRQMPPDEIVDREA